AHGVLDDAINASFIGASDFHNWTSGRTVHIWETIPATLASGTFMQHFLPFMPLVILAMGITFYRWRKNWPHEQYYPRLYVSFCVWMALTFVADILVLNPTNRAFSHYYITIVPSL